jgi:hypothetical protein
MSELFEKTDLPRRRPVKRMRIEDVGIAPDGRCIIQFVCRHCRYDTGWIIDERTVSESKRGLPCPKCNRL